MYFCGLIFSSLANIQVDSSSLLETKALSLKLTLVDTSRKHCLKYKPATWRKTSLSSPPLLPAVHPYLPPSSMWTTVMCRDPLARIWTNSNQARDNVTVILCAFQSSFNASCNAVENFVHRISSHLNLYLDLQLRRQERDGLEMGLWKSTSLVFT